MVKNTGLTVWSGGMKEWEEFEPSREMIEDLKVKRAERDRVFRENGIDTKALTDFVIGTAEPFSGPVLDIGTGRGLAAVELARRGHEVVTIDPDREIVKSAVANAVAEKVESLISFNIADVNDIPFEDGSFPLALMINVIHHLDDAANLLPEVSRVLSPGGRFLFCDFTEKGFEILDRIHGDEGADHSHFSGETVESLAGKLKDYGMRCIGRDRRHHLELVIAQKS
ncbi:MAG TPA: class I SAM-dependent methyltransferase [Candidatus Krumholzibacterium sp.]|nr:class I SAM-dependent methyltransferase [Candidatus Krumholzibacterium sp.]